VLEPEEEGGFTVRVPSFAEIVTYDANEHEALEMAKDAIRLVLEGSAARGEAMRLSVTPTCCSISGIAVASVWPSYGLPGSALTWATNWPPLERRCHTHLHAELIGAVSLALTDAFDFRSMQAVDLVTPLSLALLAYLARPHQLHDKDRLQGNDATELASQPSSGVPTQQTALGEENLLHRGDTQGWWEVVRAHSTPRLHHSSLTLSRKSSSAFRDRADIRLKFAIGRPRPKANFLTRSAFVANCPQMRVCRVS
jgi:antitoxin HicB